MISRHRERRREDRRKIQLGIHEGWEGVERRKGKDRRLLDPYTGKPKSSTVKSASDIKKQRELLDRQKERELSNRIKQQRKKKDIQ